MSGLRERLMRLRGNSAQSAAKPEGTQDPPVEEAGNGPWDAFQGEDGMKSVCEEGGQEEDESKSVSEEGGHAGDTEGSEERGPAADRVQADESGSPNARDVSPVSLDDLPPEWHGLGVKAAQSPEGEFLLREIRYPLTYRHGIHGLSELNLAVEGLAAFDKVQARQAADGGRRRIRRDKGVLAPESVGAAAETEHAISIAEGAADTERAIRTAEGATDTERAISTAEVSGSGRAFTSGIEPGSVLFLDLETTGLGVGAGNVPFMVGIAYMDGSESFVIEQMLIRHPAEERAMLSYLQNKLPAFTHLVTYNGRTFDWPVLQSRFIMNGFRGFAWEPVHIDLLHPSRSVWRNTLASCKLSRVEEERLGIHRESDIPGSEAPAIYFQFLAEGNPEPLLGVFKHNETDMLSLACLAIRFGHLLSERLKLAFPHSAEPEELLRTGLWLDKMGALGAAEELFARVERDERSDAACLCLLAERDKKCGNWLRAVLLWQKAVQAAERVSWPDWEAHIELAMYYEHKTKQFDMALTLAETALELAQRRYSSVRLDAKRRAELDAIRKRVDRLRAKTGRLSG
jgi:uncharacterized protein YprB with RNaseH-like and TPR domain